MNRFSKLLLSSAVLALAASPALAQDANTLKIAVPGFPPQQGFPYGGNAFYAPGVFFFASNFDRLTFVGGDGNIASGLAASWKNIDKDTWQFTLKPNVTFTNGKPVTAQAVAENIAIITSEYGKTTKVATIVPSPVSARAIDARTVEIKTKSPNPIFDREMSGLGIVEPQAWRDLGVEGFSRTPVASGPYKIKDPKWADGVLELEPHAGSWQPGKVQRLVLMAVPEDATRMQAVESAQVDVAVTVGIDDLPRIKSAGYMAYSAPVAGMTAFAMMSTRAGSPFQDRRVRQAANYAVDKENIIKNLLGGQTVPMSQAAVRGSNGYNPEVKPYPYDPQKAKQLLAEAGYPNGFKTTLEVVVSGGSGLPNAAEVYQQAAQDLTKAGIETEISGITFNDFLKKWFPPADSNDLGFSDMFGTGYNLMPYIDAIATFITSNWCEKKPSWYCNESLRPLVEKARVEFDPEKRRAILHQLMQAHHEDAPALFLVQQFDIVAVGPRVGNFAMNNRFIDYGALTIK